MMYTLNPDLFIGLPFRLPTTVAAADWLHELDFVDVQTCDVDELFRLAECAPTIEATEWLRSIIGARGH